jgi:hypothetical protein
MVYLFREQEKFSEVDCLSKFQQTEEVGFNKRKKINDNGGYRVKEMNKLWATIVVERKRSVPPYWSIPMNFVI